MKLTIILTCCISLLSLKTVYSQSSNSPSINDVAQAYGNQAQEVVNSYNHIFDKNRITALHAIDSLNSKGAYTALALALPSADDSLKPAIVDALTKATTKDKVIINALSIELGNENVIVIRQGGEDMAGQHVMKLKLVQMLSKQTGIDSSRVNVDNRQHINDFVATVDAANK